MGEGSPLGVNSHRILVTGERVMQTPPQDVADSTHAPDIPGFPWWAVVMGGGLATIGLFVWRWGYPPKKRA
ncbi:hypothetical protein [Microbacterium sp. YY-01]|uniref:hypothetical protein n=1 Tax=Microbacterium sp. YY-01 TaxID=3421634 RepID=UPI003D183A37